jgi:hypothetical protein
MSRFSSESPVTRYFVDFVERYKSQAPISGEEAAQRYEQAVFTLDDAALGKALTEQAHVIFGKLTTDEKQALDLKLHDALKRVAPDLSYEAVDVQNPELRLGRMTFEIEKHKRGDLVNLFGTVGGYAKPVRQWANTPLAKKTLSGIAAGVADFVLPEHGSS